MGRFFGAVEDLAACMDKAIQVLPDPTYGRGGAGKKVLVKSKVLAPVEKYFEGTSCMLEPGSLPLATTSILSVWMITASCLSTGISGFPLGPKISRASMHHVAKAPSKSKAIK